MDKRKKASIAREATGLTALQQSLKDAR